MTSAFMHHHGDILARRPFSFRCASCNATALAATIDPPANSGCESETHAWRRRVELDRVRVHEAGHALVALAVGGPGTVKMVRVEGKGQSDTETTLEPFGVPSLLTTLGGRSASALLGDPRDGWFADSGRFHRSLLGWLTRHLSPASLSSIETDFGHRLAGCVTQAFAELEQITRMIVKDNRPVLSGIALALREGPLDGERLEQLLAQSSLCVPRAELSAALTDGYAEALWRRI